MGKHSQAPIITIPGDFSCNDISRYKFWLVVDTNVCNESQKKRILLFLLLKHLNYCPLLHSEIYPGPRHPDPVTSKHSSPRTHVVSLQHTSHFFASSGLLDNSPDAVLDLSHEAVAALWEFCQKERKMNRTSQSTRHKREQTRSQAKSTFLLPSWQL